MSTFEANGRCYTVTPGTPVVVVCIDGSEPAYHQHAMADGAMPWLRSLLDDGRGVAWPAHSALPALTNPNNVSIATGVPPAVHGISGNYLLDPDTGEEVLMQDPAFLRVPTLFAGAAAVGLRVQVVTAKDKLRRLLGQGLPAGACRSAEGADDELTALVGRPRPDVYSAGLSEFVMAAGVRLLERGDADLLYLSLSDYVQHKHAPGTPAATDFYAMLDAHAARLHELGAVVVLTADHGMSAKADDAGRPRVLFLADEVRAVLGPDDGDLDADLDARVVLPITDPYLAHHGALGSFASLHLPATAPTALRGRLLDALRSLPGVEEAHDRATAAERYALPADRIGDVVVLADADTALGATARAGTEVDLDAPLRSHGALGEIAVPFLVNRPLPDPEPALQPVHDFGRPALLHNYDAFWVGTTLASQTLTAQATR